MKMTTKGAPYPLQEENAIDCVMRFAIDYLTFPEEQIILYGWSIGGYTATWAAMNYPSIQSLVRLLYYLFYILIYIKYFKNKITVVKNYSKIFYRY